MHSFKLGLFCLSALFLAACQSPASEGRGSAGAKAVFSQPPPAHFGDYWYQGEAELTSYTLRQNRYRDTHPGEAVLIFVTEDFLTDKQVKDEKRTSPNSTTVLKTNMIRRFSTGLYDYSVMTSVFTPVEAGAFPHTLKVTHSSQDWCGQTFMQVNQERKRYRVREFSYFEEEGDTDFPGKALPIEDELFNRIRLNPETLPTGSLEMYPSLTFCRLNHRPFTPHRAEAALRPYEGDRFSGPGLREYYLQFPEVNRTVSIVFEEAFPHRIEGWTESYPSVSDGMERTTVARRRETITAPYWELNNRRDMALRDTLAVGGL